jgi:hypothetical protein
MKCARKTEYAMVVALVPRNIDRRWLAVVRAIEAKFEYWRVTVGRVRSQLSANKYNENGLDKESISDSNRSDAPPEAAGHTAALCHADAHERRAYG